MGAYVLRFLFWRVLALIALIGGASMLAWFLDGGPGRLLRGHGDPTPHLDPGAAARTAGDATAVLWRWHPDGGPAVVRPLLALSVAAATMILLGRATARSRRRYVRLTVEPYRGDHAEAAGLVRMFEALHKRLQRRWWRRLLTGQPSLSLEVHHGGGAAEYSAWLAVSCPSGLEAAVEAALRVAYPSVRLHAGATSGFVAPAVVRLKKRAEFVMRSRAVDRFEQDGDPPINRLLTIMDAGGQRACVQLALTPAPAAFESIARHALRRREERQAHRRRERLISGSSIVEQAELRGALELQHRSFFFLDLRVIAPSLGACQLISSELRAQPAENRLVERGTAVRHGLLRLYSRRILRGEGNPLAPSRRGVFATTELASLWQVPSIDYLTVPFARSAVPLAPAPPAILRPRAGGTLRDAHGPVSIAVEQRRQNTAVPGTVEQGKSSYLVATVAEDVRRERCAVIVLDPKGDAAEAALSVVPVGRGCTLLDFSHPTCGFNPLAVDAPADVIADYVVAALKNLFTDDGVILGL